MFAAICALQVLANFDNGVLPSVLSSIQLEFSLDFSELGLLGALVYVGLVASCPLSGYLLTRCGSPRLVLVGSVALNTGALLLFAAAPAPEFLLVARALIGLSQAPIFIYAPVWVDTFAPPAYMTLWISLLQANVAIGIMLGYVFGGGIVAGAGAAAWRVPLYVQAGCMAPFVLFYLLVPDQYVSLVGGLAERIAKLEEEAQAEEEAEEEQEQEVEAAHGASSGAAPGGEWSSGPSVRRKRSGASRRALVGAGAGLGTLAEAEEDEDEEEDDDNESPGAPNEAARAPGVAGAGGRHAAQEGAPRPGRPLGRSAGGAGRPSLPTARTAVAAARSADALGVGGLSAREAGSPVCDQAEGGGADGAGVGGERGPVGEAGMPALAGGGDDEISLLEGTAALLCNRIFMLLTVGLTGLYFVVTGIQFWISDYLIKDIGADPAAVVAGFAVTSLTAPTMGVFFGGWLVDRMGGYKDDTGQSAFVTLRVCCLFGVGAAVAAMPAAFLTDFWGVLVSVWFVLFFGGALLPAVTGVAISAVPAELRSVGNALSLLTYNLFGYAAAPYVCGVIASSIGIAWGFRVVMFASFVALMPVAVASCVARPSASYASPGGALAGEEALGSSDTDDNSDVASDGPAPPPESGAPEGGAAAAARPPAEPRAPHAGSTSLSVDLTAIDASATGLGPAAPTRPRARSRRGTVTDVFVTALAHVIGVPDPVQPDAAPREAGGASHARVESWEQGHAPAPQPSGSAASSAAAPGTGPGAGAGHRPAAPRPHLPAGGRDRSSTEGQTIDQAPRHAPRPRRLSALHFDAIAPSRPTADAAASWHRRGSAARSSAAGSSAGWRSGLSAYGPGGAAASLRRSTGLPGASGSLAGAAASAAGEGSRGSVAGGAARPTRPSMRPRRVSGMVAVLGDISMHATRGRAVTSFFRNRHIFEGVDAAVAIAGGGSGPRGSPEGTPDRSGLDRRVGGPGGQASGGSALPARGDGPVAGPQTHTAPDPANQV